MNHKITVRGVLCTLMAAVLLGLAVEAPMVQAAGSREEAKEKVEELQEQLDKEKQELKKAQKKGKDAAAAKKSYQAQSSIVKEQIQTLTVTLDETQAAIAEKENEINEKQAEIDARWDRFKDQMAAMQMMHDGGAVAMLSDVKSLYELLTFADVLQQMSQKQNEVLADMQQRRDEVQAVRDELEEKKDELEIQKQSLDSKKQELAGSIQLADKTITSAEAEAQAQQVQVEATEEALKAAQKEFDSYINSLPDSGSAYVGETFIWPTNSTRITQYFGNNGHGGMDIGAVRPGVDGDPIYAAASGVVQVSAWHQHTYSYGNYVVIDHGGGIKTLYAHMSSRAVSAGQTVKQGDIIGYMGNTGYSFGTHLHFEVRVNGSRVNPMGYYHKA